MTETRWIVIPKWDDFQHRDMARSTVPPWIKTYTKLMGDDDFLDLTFHLRGLLISLWLEYATARRQLSGSTVRLSRRLGMKVTERDLQSLNHAGFVQFSASKPASNSASGLASLEVEKSREEYKSLETDAHEVLSVSDPSKSKSTPLATTRANGDIPATLDFGSVLETAAAGIDITRRKATP